MYSPAHCTPFSLVFCFLKESFSLPPQDLCTCSFFSLRCSLHSQPHIPSLINYYSSFPFCFRSKYCFLKEAFPDCQITSDITSIWSLIPLTFSVKHLSKFIIICVCVCVCVCALKVIYFLQSERPFIVYKFPMVG